MNPYQSQSELNAMFHALFDQGLGQSQGGYWQTMAQAQHQSAGYSQPHHKQWANRVPILNANGTASGLYA